MRMLEAKPLLRDMKGGQMSTKYSEDDVPTRATGAQERGPAAANPQPGLLRRWFCPNRPTCRRTVIGLALTVVVLAVGLAIMQVIEPDDPVGLSWIVAFFVIGLYMRSWRALWVAFVGGVIPMALVEIGQYLYLGAAEWEQRNLEHWPGDASPLSKLSGQLLEFVVFGIMFALVAGLGALIGYGLQDWWRGRRRSGGPTQSPTA